MTRSRTKKFILALMVLGGILPGVSRAQTPTATPPFIKYTHKTLGFSLLVPSDWTIKEDWTYQGYSIPMLAVGPLMNGDDGRENLNVVPEDIRPTDSTEDYLNKSLPSIPKFTADFKELSRGNLTGGFPHAMYMVYTHSSPKGASLKAIVFYYTQGHKGYTLTCTATARSFDNFKDLFMAIGKSFTPAAASKP